MLQTRYSKSLSQVQNFQIYYGPVNDSAMQMLRSVDLVLLEPRQVTLEQVRELRDCGVLVFGYLSVMETPTWNQERFRKLNDTDFLHNAGQKIHFPTWDSYLMDLRRSSYQETLLEELQVTVLAKEMDGLFLDTVGDIEEYVPDDLREDVTHAYLRFLQQITRLAPALHLIQNRGFDLLPYVHSYLYGVLWEDWRGDLVQDPWVQVRLKLLKTLCRTGLQAFTVSADPHLRHAATAVEHGFVHLTRLNGYNTL